MSDAMKLCSALLAALCIAGCAGRPQATAPKAQSRAEHTRELYDEGVSLAASGDLTRAEQYLATAHSEGGRDRASLVALLSVCLRASRFRSALAHAEPYVHQHPRDVRLWQLTASLHYALGELTSARSLLEHVLRVDPARPEAHYLLARVHLSLLQSRAALQANEHKRALRQHFARYLTLSPEGAHAEEARAELVSSAARRDGSARR
jgi:predicted Zn-dependent protease